VINIEDYYIFNPIRLNKRKKLAWLELWINKSNYITNYYESIKGKYSIIDESIDYYIAMLEMGICYLNKYFGYYDYVYQQHSIIIDNESAIKEDIKERDFAEYLKYLFYNNYDICYIYNYIDRGSQKFDYYLVVCRLLFPSYYFYYFEKVVNDNKFHSKLKRIIDLSKEYEDYLNKVVDRMNRYLVKKIILPF